MIEVMFVKADCFLFVKRAQVTFISEYFCEYPIEYKNFFHLEKTVAEIKAAYRLHLLEFLEMLRNLEVGAAPQEKIFFATRLRAKVETVLCTRADILASDKPETYAWIFEDFGK